jgi:hypothetical protein
MHKFLDVLLVLFVSFGTIWVFLEILNQLTK